MVAHERLYACKLLILFEIRIHGQRTFNSSKVVRSGVGHDRARNERTGRESTFFKDMKEQSVALARLRTQGMIDDKYLPGGYASYPYLCMQQVSQ